jgi:hypothetical protein
VSTEGGEGASGPEKIRDEERLILSSEGRLKARVRFEARSSFSGKGEGGIREDKNFSPPSIGGNATLMGDVLSSTSSLGLDDRDSPVANGDVTGVSNASLRIWSRSFFSIEATQGTAFACTGVEEENQRDWRWRNARLVRCRQIDNRIDP